MPEVTSEDKSDYQRLKPKEFLNISVWILKFVFGINKKYVVVYTATSILNRLTDIGNTLIISKLLDTVVVSVQSKTADLNSIYYFLAILFGFNVIETAISLGNTWSWNGLVVSGRPKIRRAFYKKINELGIQTLEQPEINNRIYRADTNLGNLTGYLDQTIGMVANIIMFFSFLFIITSFLPFFTLIIIISVIPFFIFDRNQRSNLYKFVNKNTEKQRMAGATVTDLTNSKDLQEITLTQSFNFMDNKYWNFQENYIKSQIRILTKWRVGVSSLMSISDIAVIFGVGKVFFDAFSKAITVGTTLFRYRVLNRFQGSIQNILRNLNDLSEQAILISDVHYVFNLKPAFPEGDLPFAKINTGPDIVFDDVNFKYPNSEKLVLKNLNLKIKTGEKIAIVGSNGAGKTTTVKLICKLYQTESGKILINDQNLKDINIRDWHKNIGVLFQDYNNYPQLTVKENILIGNADTPVDETAIRLAAEQADASEFINEYPLKFDQVLSEKYKGGVRPSTGQWQKLAIARFFYRNAPLVIFDEPTASIDAVSEFNIFNRIYEFFKNKTVIIISHRFSTVRNADRILVLEGGNIVEEGNHQQLMEKGGKYAKAFLLQASGYQDKTNKLY